MATWFKWRFKDWRWRPSLHHTNRSQSPTSSSEESSSRSQSLSALRTRWCWPNLRTMIRCWLISSSSTRCNRLVLPTNQAVSNRSKCWRWVVRLNTLWGEREKKIRLVRNWKSSNTSTSWITRHANTSPWDQPSHPSPPPPLLTSRVVSAKVAAQIAKTAEWRQVH